MFLFWGVRGQRIIIDPQSKLVMVNTAVHKLPLDRAPLRKWTRSGRRWCVSPEAIVPEVLAMIAYQPCLTLLAPGGLRPPVKPALG